MRLSKIREVTGKIILKSGLRIGAGDMEMQIGGTDNPIIKHPHTLEPYIPGSSLKGKVRSLLEMRSGLMIHTEGRPLQPQHLNGLGEKERKEGEKILKLFGAGGSADPEEKGKLGPTRVSFSDCPLDENWRLEANQKRLSLVEVKSENSINRIRGTAENPRFTERVPAGAKFNFSISLKILVLNEENEFMDCLLTGLKLLEMDALGGSGSRGYGRIDLEIDDPEIHQLYENQQIFA